MQLSFLWVVQSAAGPERKELAHRDAMGRPGAALDGGRSAAARDTPAVVVVEPAVGGRLRRHHGYRRFSIGEPIDRICVFALRLVFVFVTSPVLSLLMFWFFTEALPP